MSQELGYDLKTAALSLGFVQAYSELALEMNLKKKETLRAFDNASYVFTDLGEADDNNEHQKPKKRPC